MQVLMKIAITVITLSLPVVLRAKEPKYRLSGGFGYGAIVYNTSDVNIDNNDIFNLAVRVAFRMIDRLYFDIEAGGMIGTKISPLGLHALLLLDYDIVPTEIFGGPYIDVGLGGGILWPVVAENGDEPYGLGPLVLSAGFGLRNLIKGFGLEARSLIHVLGDTTSVTVIGLLTYCYSWD